MTAVHHHRKAELLPILSTDEGMRGTGNTVYTLVALTSKTPLGLLSPHCARILGQGTTSGCKVGTVGRVLLSRPCEVWSAPTLPYLNPGHAWFTEAEVYSRQSPGCREQINEEDGKMGKSRLFFLAEITRAHSAVSWNFLGPEVQFGGFGWTRVRHSC